VAPPQAGLEFQYTWAFLARRQVRQATMSSTIRITSPAGTTIITMAGRTEDTTRIKEIGTI